MAAINAIKVLEQIDDDPASSAARRSAPGVVIVIADGASHMTQIRPTQQDQGLIDVAPIEAGSDDAGA